MFKKFKSCFTIDTMRQAAALCIAIAFFLFISNIGKVATALDAVKGVMSPFIYAFALSFLLNRPEKALEDKVFYKLKGKSKKSVSVFTTFILFFIVVSVLLRLVIPQIGYSLAILAEVIPGFVTRVYEMAMKMMKDFHFSEAFTTQMSAVLENYGAKISEFLVMSIAGIYNFSKGVSNFVVKSLMVVVVTLYMLMDKDRLKFQVKKFLYAYCEKDSADRIVDIAHRSEKIFSDFIIGKIIDSAIIGAIAFVGMMFIYRDYAVLIALIIGVTNVIPFFGPFIGAIPSIFILLMSNPLSAVIFAVFILILQQIDGNIIGPKILGDSLGLSALWILVAIVIGNGLFGFVGMIIGVPSFAVLYNLVSENISDKLEKKNIRPDSENNTIKFD